MKYEFTIDQATTPTGVILPNVVLALGAGPSEGSMPVQDKVDVCTTAQIYPNAPFPFFEVKKDQNMATIGQAKLVALMLNLDASMECSTPLDTGDTAARSQSRLPTTTAGHWLGKAIYVYERSILLAGTVVLWLRGVLDLNQELPKPLAEAGTEPRPVVLQSLLSGSGVSYRESESRGATSGLNRCFGPEGLAATTMKNVRDRTRDLLVGMCADVLTKGTAWRAATTMRIVFEHHKVSKQKAHERQFVSAISVALQYQKHAHRCRPVDAAVRYSIL